MLKHFKSFTKYLYGSTNHLLFNAFLKMRFTDGEFFIQSTIA